MEIRICRYMRGWTLPDLWAMPSGYLEAITAEMEERGGGEGLGEELDEDF